ncbi:MAG: OmpA family protein [Candidatus Ozemobacteraceae bacterium]
MMSRRGYILLLVILGAISLAFFSFSLSSLNRGYRSQVIHTRQVQASFQIAYSGFQRVLGKIYLKPWEERFFRTSPVAENGLALYGGVYDNFVQNVAGKTTQADIYIRVKLEDVTRNYVWRIEHVPDLLDAKYFTTLVFTQVPVEEFPAGGTAPYSQTLNDIVQKRETNRPQSEDLRSRIAGVNTVQDIATILGAPALVIPPRNKLPTVHPLVPAPSITISLIPSLPPHDSLVTNPIPYRGYPNAAQMARQLTQAGKVVLRQISFEFDRNDLLPSSFPILEEVQKLLQMVPGLKLSIEGHTSTDGGLAYNQTLSEKRAGSVSEWLITHGVSSSRLNSIGYGQTRPIADNDTSAGRIKNRRVELVKMP